MTERREMTEEFGTFEGRIPPDDLGKTFYLYRQKYEGNVIGSSPHVYICDIQRKRRIWVSSEEIMLKLGYNQEMVKSILKKDLESYELGLPLIFD